MSLSNAAESTTRGFTLLEALVALSIVAVVLSSIGALIAGSIKATRTLEARGSRLAAVKLLLVELPARHQLVPGSKFGDLAGNAWRIDVSPYIARNEPKTLWVPQTIVLRVKNPGAADIQVQTVRLARREAK